jgi:hypothetical protein
MQFCVTRVILRDLAALVPQIFHSLHKITHFLTGYINSYFWDLRMIIDGTSIKNLIHIGIFQQYFKIFALVSKDFSSNNHKMLENMTCILSAISDSFAIM